MKVKTKSKKVNKAWLNDHINDPYVKLAQKEGYRARAAYKLKEIDEALGLIKPGQVVVDLGAAPGAWSQYLRRRFAPKEAGAGGAAAGALNGRIIALDLLDFEPIEGVQFIQGDFHDEAVLAELSAAIGGRGVDVVVSDMAPNLSGIAPQIPRASRCWWSWRSNSPKPTSIRTARWSARCSTAAATASWSSCSRSVSGS
ncbi:Ribosomal RNA large subunit methyltransferase E [Methylibium sp. T29-B]|nr:Ribosomal RNA large subunit methyltransferase E [Methylibium sp. T29-B]